MQLRTTWNHIRRSPYQAFAAIFILTQTFFVISLFTFLIVGSGKILNYFESKSQISAYFKDNATQANIDILKSKLKETGKIADLRFVSKQQALAIYKEQNKNDPILLELVTPDTLPASFEISTIHIEDLGGIADILKSSSIVNEVIYQKDVVKKLSNWTNALREIGIGLITILTLDSIFLMVIIIGIKISQKKEEIEIMRLLGATNWHISLPFIIEGIFYGVIGAFVGWLFSSVTVSMLTGSTFVIGFLEDPLLISEISFSPVFSVIILGGELFLAILLGALSSYLAARRYLK